MSRRKKQLQEMLTDVNDLLKISRTQILMLSRALPKDTEGRITLTAAYRDILSSQNRIHRVKAWLDNGR